MASSEMSPYLQSFEKIAFLKAYKCSQCNRIYSTQINNGNVCGRVPLLLPCSHSICEECIQKMVKYKNVACKICKFEMVLEENPQSFRALFPIDRYMFGALLNQGLPEHRPRYVDRSKQQQPYQPAGAVPRIKSVKKESPKEQRKQTPSKVAEKCTFVECSKDAEWICNSCGEIFCSTCDQKVHNSLNILRSHTRHLIAMSALTDFTTFCELPHNVMAEYTCTSCQLLLCSNCVIKKHQSHDVISIEDQNITDLNAFKETRLKAIHVLRCMKATQNKIKQEISNGQQHQKPSNVEYEIIKHFSDLHSRLQMVEVRMLDQYFKARSARHASLQEISNNLEENIKTLTPLVETAKVSTMKEKLEKVILAKLTETINSHLELPCDLIESSEPNANIRFQIDNDIVGILDTHCQVNIKDNDSLYLAPITDFPDEISVESITTDDTDSVRSGSSSLLSGLSNNSTMTNSSYRQSGSKTIVSIADRTTTAYHCNSTARKYDQKPAEDPVNLLPGRTENVFVTHLVNPSLFYVQLTRKAREINNLTSRYENYARTVTPPSSLDINSCYIVQFKAENNAKWYRARLINIKESDMEPLYEMFFIDYGNTALVPLGKIRPMQQIFSKDAPFAHRCRLDGIISLGNEWNPQVLEYMIKFISGNENPALKMDDLTKFLLDGSRNSYLKMFIAKNYKGILDVDLIANNESLRYALCFVGHATSISKISSLPKVNSISLFGQTKIMPSIDNYKRNQVNIVRVTSIIHPQHIYVQRLDVKKDIDRLEDIMTKYYNRNYKYIFTPETGMYCASQCATSKKWRRTEILSCPGDGKVEVFLLDYGTTEISSWNEHRKLNEKHKQMDAQAIKASLSDIEPSDGSNWTQESINFLIKCCESKEFKMYVNENTRNQLEITLFDSTPTIDICINALLVKKEHAESTGESSLLVEYHKIIEEVGPEKMETKRHVEQLLSRIQTFPDQSIETSDIMGKTYHVAVEVIFIESPSCFYVTPIKWKELKLRLHKKLAKFYVNQISPEKKWNIDEYCVVRSIQDNHYYRGYVTKVLDNNKYEVFMKDIVRTEILPKEHIFELEDNFVSQDLSLKCSLSDVIPAGGTGKWPGMTIEYFHELVSKYNQLYITKYGKIVDKTIPVRLLAIWEEEHGPLEPSSMKQIILNRCLIENGLALPVQVEPLPEDSSDDTLTQISDSGSKSKESFFGLEQMVIQSNIGDIFKNDSAVKTWRSPHQIDETRFKAWPSYVDENGHVYIQNLAARNNLKNISRILNSQYLKTSPDPPHEWKSGQMCIVQYHLDKSFNRGTVVSTKPDGVILVKLVDYGNVEECSHSELRSEVALTDLPIMTVECTLSDVYPKTKDNNWPEPVLDTLHHMVVDKECEVIVVEDDTSNDLISIMISVNNSLVNSEVMGWDWNKTEGMVISDVLSGDDDKSVIIEGEIEEDELGTEIQDDLKPVQIDNHYQKITIPDEQISFDAFIINVLDYKTVMIEASFMADGIRSSEIEFEDLLADINADAADQPLLAEITVGAPCVALFDDDNRWYRAEIYDISDPEKPTVLFVDYGNVDNIPIENIRSFKQNWVQFPVQMLKCKLYNIKKSDDIDDETAIEHMQSSLLDKRFICQVMTFEPELEVKLIDSETFALAYEDLAKKNLFYFTD